MAEERFGRSGAMAREPQVGGRRNRVGWKRVGRSEARANEDGEGGREGSEEGKSSRVSDGL